MISSTISHSVGRSTSHPTADPRLTANRPRVLIVEDHDDSRQMLRVLLEMRRCDVFEACNGLEAVEIAGREQPVLILMDGSLPLLDGLEATRRIRENVELREVLILASPSLQGLCGRHGVNECSGAGVVRRPSY